MAAGQGVLSGSWDLPGLKLVEDRLEARRFDDGRAYAGKLRDVLELHSQHCLAGMELATEPVVARLLGVSEWKAGKLLHEALGLAGLPGAFEALEAGVLMPDQCLTLVDRLAPLTPPQRVQVWQRLLVRLQEDARRGAVLPPARLGELLKGWVQQVAPQDAVDRRKAAEQDRSVQYRKRDDGLADIFLIGLKPTDARAVLQKIRDASTPVSVWDDRLADQRRLDAAVDLLLGRDPLGRDPLGTGHGAGHGPACAGAAGGGSAAGGSSAAACGCLPGQAAPCGASINVFVTHNGALGTTDEPATMDRHGPIEPDLLQALLLNAPVLRAVFVNEHGTPIGISRQRLRPERGDPESVRAALLRLGNLTPDRLFPVHPEDHPPPENGPPDSRSGSAAAPGPAPCLRSHPPDTPGPYRVTGLLRELVFARAPRCEFPGCGMPATVCDAEHDLPWPLGPTCSCQLGPCCRHHHRIKQLGWCKTRHTDGSLTWTSPTGRTTWTRSQHDAPQPPTRALTPLSEPTEWDELNPDELDETLWILHGRPEDPTGLELRAQDPDPDDVPPPERVNTCWSWDLDDPYAWEPPQSPFSAAAPG